MSSDPFLFVAWLREQSPIAPFARAFRVPRSATFSVVYFFWAGLLLILDHATHEAADSWANLAVRAVFGLLVLFFVLMTISMLGSSVAALRLGRQRDRDLERKRQDTLRLPRGFLAEMVFAVWGALYLLGFGSPLLHRAAALAWAAMLVAGVFLGVWRGLQGCRAALRSRRAAPGR